MQLTESRIQQEIVVWFTNEYCLKHNTPRELILHVPNEQSQHLIRVGVLPGASDLILTYRGKLYWCEVKTPTGIQSPKQKEFEQRVTDLGYTYFITRSKDQFQNQLQKFK